MGLKVRNHARLVTSGGKEEQPIGVEKKPICTRIRIRSPVRDSTVMWVPAPLKVETGHGLVADDQRRLPTAVKADCRILQI